MRGKQKMYKKILITILTTLSLFFTACGKQTNAGTAETPPAPDSSAIPQENTLFQPADISDYPSMTNATKHVFLEGPISDTLDLFETGTAAIFFSYPECPFCNLVMPILNNVAQENNYSVILLDAYRPEFDKENFDRFKSLFPEVESEDGNIYTPQLIIIKDGKVIDSFTGVPGDISHMDDATASPYLEDDQKAIVATTYLEMLNKLR